MSSTVYTPGSSPCGMVMLTLCLGICKFGVWNQGRMSYSVYTPGSSSSMRSGEQLPQHA